jgi:hypothetical protein
MLLNNIHAFMLIDTNFSSLIPSVSRKLQVQSLRKIKQQLFHMDNRPHFTATINNGKMTDIYLNLYYLI